MRWPICFTLLAACSKAPAPPAAPAAPRVKWDSLALTLPDSTTVWLIEGREGRGADGATCRERSVELRKGSTRTMVPLLYTRSAPRMVQGKVVATLSNHCADEGEYLIDPVTAYPTTRGAQR